MSPYPPPGRLGRKWRKFRRDPVRFFADARSPLLRWLGLGGIAGLYLAKTPVGFLDLLRNRALSLEETLWRLDAPRRRSVAGAGISRHEYARWIARYDTLSDADRSAVEAHIAAMPKRPSFSVMMTVYETHLPWLEEAITSVRAQLYPDWELCIVDDGSVNEVLRRALAHWAAGDPRIKLMTRDTNGGIVQASNDALAQATGDWVVTLDHDDQLAEHALYHLAAAIQDYPDADVFYSDHDRLTPNGERGDPYFKPDWNYELALGQNLANHLTAYRRGHVNRLGGFRKGFDGSQDWDLLLRVIEQTPESAIHHIPRILYHWRSACGGFSRSQAACAWEAGRRAVQGHLERTGQNAVASVGATSAGHLAVRWCLPKDPPLVSIIVPTRDRLDLLRRCMDGLTQRTDYPALEIILVDNGSSQAETLAYYEVLRADRRIRILEEPGAFNFSRLCNRGVAAARGEVYLLLNNDVDPIGPDWLSELVSHALRPGIGAVGAKLYYPDGSIQHGGVVLGSDGAATHAHQHLPGAAEGYQGRACLTQRVTAVTGACLAGRKAIYEEVGGLDEENLEVAFNDVDFCMKLGDAGYAVIWTPFAELWHRESVSRRHLLEDSDRDRFSRERATLADRWRGRLSAKCDFGRGSQYASGGIDANEA